MGAIDITVIVVVSVAVLAAVGVIIWRKVKHKDGCGCGGCSACDKCSKNKK